MLSEEHTWKIIGDHFKKKGFVHHQTESFDNFINVGLPKVVTEEPDIVIRPTGADKKYDSYAVSFSDIYVPSPTVIEETRELRGFNPAEARQRDLTYDSPIYATVTETVYVEGQEPEVTKHRRVVLGRIPIMLRSCRCYLTGMTPLERIRAGECEYDEGGYFVVKGKERALVMQQRAAHNVPLVFEQKPGEKTSHVCEMRSMSEETGHSVLIQATLGADDRTITLSLPYVKDSVPAGTVFKALGYEADQIRALIGMGDGPAEKYVRFLLNDSFFVDSQDDGFELFQETIGKLMAFTKAFLGDGHPIGIMNVDIDEIDPTHDLYADCVEYMRSSPELDLIDVSDADDLDDTPTVNIANRLWEQVSEESRERWRKQSTRVNALKYIGSRSGQSCEGNREEVMC